MQRCYTGVSPERFAADLEEKQYVILLHTRRGGELVGFSTLRVAEASTGGQQVEVVYSGDTVIHPEWWGHKVLQVCFGRFVLWRKLRHPMRPLHWLLLSAGFKTYLLAVNSFPRTMPRRDWARTTACVTASRPSTARRPRIRTSPSSSNAISGTPRARSWCVWWRFAGGTSSGRWGGAWPDSSEARPGAGGGPRACGWRPERARQFRFGMGLSTVRVRSPERRDRLLLVSALAQVLLTLLGAAGESLGMEKGLKANSAKTRTYSLFRQGCMYYQAIPMMKEERLLPLVERFSELLHPIPSFRMHSASCEGMPQGLPVSVPHLSLCSRPLRQIGLLSFLCSEGARQGLVRYFEPIPPEEPEGQD